MEEPSDKETDPRKVLAGCPVKMKPLTAFFERTARNKKENCPEGAKHSAEKCDSEDHGINAGVTTGIHRAKNKAVRSPEQNSSNKTAPVCDGRGLEFESGKTIYCYIDANETVVATQCEEDSEMTSDIGDKVNNKCNAEIVKGSHQCDESKTSPNYNSPAPCGESKTELQMRNAKNETDNNSKAIERSICENEQGNGVTDKHNVIAAVKEVSYEDFLKSSIYEDRSSSDSKDATLPHNPRDASAETPRDTNADGCQNTPKSTSEIIEVGEHYCKTIPTKESGDFGGSSAVVRDADTEGSCSKADDAVKQNSKTCPGDKHLKRDTVEEKGKYSKNSILNFFTKTGKTKGDRGVAEKGSLPSQGMVQTVTVDVHPEPVIPEKPTPARSFDIFNIGARKSGLENKRNSENENKSPSSNVSVPKKDFDETIIVIDSYDNNTVPGDYTANPPEVTTPHDSTSVQAKKKSSSAHEEKQEEKIQKKEGEEAKSKVLGAAFCSLDNVVMPSGKNVQTTLQLGGNGVKLTKAGSVASGNSEETEGKTKEREMTTPKRSNGRGETLQTPGSCDSSQENELDSSAVDFTPRSRKTSAPRAGLKPMQAEVEIGHKATIRKKPTEEGHTHDWRVFLRFADDSPLREGIEKVVFKLHETFPNPQRVFTEPPYEVHETGYGGFDLPIYVHLRSYLKPRMASFIYDLFLVANKPTENIRTEKITLRNASQSHREKLQLQSNKKKMGKLSKAKKLLQKAKGAKVLSPKSPRKLAVSNSLNKKPANLESVPKLNLRQASELATKKSKTLKKNSKNKKVVDGKENRGKENTPRKVDRNQNSRNGTGSKEEGEVEGCGLRRSSRSSAVRAVQKMTHVIDDDTEVSSEGPTPRKNRRRAGVDSDVDSPSTARRGRKRERPPSDRSPKNKKARKLAPIFSMKVKDNESDSEPEVVELTEEDKEKARVRQAFLMSGVPQELRKQAAQQSAALATRDHPPWPGPSQNHVRQKSSDSLWDEKELPLTLKGLSDSVPRSPAPLDILSKTKAPAIDVHSLVEYTEHVPIRDETVRLLLAEIASCNPSYPVRRVFKQLFARKQEADKQPESVPVPAVATEMKVETENSKKRKLEENNEGTPSKGRKRRKRPSSPAGDEGNEKRRPDRRRNGRNLEEKALDPEKAESDVAERAESDTDIITIDLDDSENKTVDAGSCKRDLLWTDKYAPTCMSEVLGKANTIKKLYAWLESWKKITDLEMRRMAKELEKQQRRQRATQQSRPQGKNFSDESDFESQSSDSDYDPDEDDITEGLCNTMLIQGPHGVGKTSVVYALAQELGYKVFEVNAAHRRSGRQVLQQLQEATQSHHVANKNLTDVFSTILSGESIKPKEENKEPSVKKSKTKSAAAAFNTLFGGRTKKTPVLEGESSPRKKSSRRSRRKSSDDVEIIKEEYSPARKRTGQTTVAVPVRPTPEVGKKALDLSSCSLILFEEADVVMEEDKGFWAAIQTFMNTTKRPIVLTTTQANFVHFFDPKSDMRIDMLNLKFPKMSNTVTYLQLVCLAENLRTDHRDVMSLVEYHQGDIRQSLIALQLWAETGGSRQPIRRDVTHRRNVLIKSSGAVTEDEGIGTSATNSQISDVTNASHPAVMCLIADSADDESQNSEEEFDLPTARTRRLPKRAVIEDESSLDSLPSTPRKATSSLEQTTQGNTAAAVGGNQDAVKRTQSSLWALAGERESNDSCVVAFDDKTPLLHGDVFEWQFGITGQHCDQGTPDNLPSILCRLRSGDVGSIDIVSRFCARDVDVIWCNLLPLLPLPKKIVPLHTYTNFIRKKEPAKVKVSRIKNRSDLFDSDSQSEEEFQSLKAKSSMTGEELTKLNGDVNKGRDGNATGGELPSGDSKCQEHKDTSGANISGNADRCEVECRSRVLAPENKLVIASLDSIAAMSDNFSFCDSCLRLSDDSQSGARTRPYGSRSQSELISGHSEQPVIDHNADPWKYTQAGDICASVKYYSLQKASKELSVIQGAVSDLGVNERGILVDKMTLPTEASHSYTRTSDLSGVQQSLQQAYQKALDNVYDHVNPRSRRDINNASGHNATCSVSRRAVAMDYMPSLRHMGKAEQLREIAKTKRRFLHYFHANHISIKASTLDTMNSSFL